MARKSKDQILAELAELLQEFTDLVKPEDITADMKFEDQLGMDSLIMVDAAMAAEDHFGVKIPTEELKTSMTVGEMVNFIYENQPDADGE